MNLEKATTKRQREMILKASPALFHGFDGNAFRHAISKLMSSVFKIQGEYLFNLVRGRAEVLGEHLVDLGRLIEAGNLEARIHISDAAYGRVLDSEGGLAGRAAKVIWRAGDGGAVYDAVVDRVGARIDAATGGVSVYARVIIDAAETPLRPGAFVEVWLPDRLYPAVARLPESALFGDATVYVVADDRLVSRRVEVAGRDGNHVLLRGALSDGDRVVITRFAEIGPGVAVEVR